MNKHENCTEQHIYHHHHKRLQELKRRGKQIVEIYIHIYRHIYLYILQSYISQYNKGVKSFNTLTFILKKFRIEIY